MVQTIRFFSPPSFSSSSSFALGGAFLSSCHFFLEGRKILWRHQTPPTTLPFKNKQRSVTKSESLFLFLARNEIPSPFFFTALAPLQCPLRGAGEVRREREVVCLPLANESLFTSPPPFILLGGFAARVRYPPRIIDRRSSCSSSSSSSSFFGRWRESLSRYAEERRRGRLMI